MHMHRSIQACLWAALLLGGGCRDMDTKQPDQATGPADMSSDDGAVQSNVTIRDLNQGKVPDATKVKVTGVVTSPILWINLSSDKLTCYYNVFIAMADPAPTLQDGIRVNASLKGMAAMTITTCKDAGKDFDIAKLAMSGHTIEVTGRFESNKTSGDRQVYLTGGNGIVDKGAAMTLPVPVVVEAKALMNGDSMSFKDAQNALVVFQNVKVSDVNMYQEFMVSTDGATNKATISANFLKAQPGSFMAPAAGTTLKSLTGLALTDFKGEIWPRTKDDIVAQ